MAIKFQSYQGQLFICDFKGYQVPEIVKRRPVIAISPPDIHRTDLCTIVPISTTKPDPKTNYHYFLEDLPKIPYFDKGFGWVKCDLIYTVSFQRLYLPCLGKSNNGKRNYLNYKVQDKDLAEIMNCVMYSLGILR